jgi:hypothetical protein
MPLPETFEQMERKYGELPFINIMCNMSGIRAYYHKKTYNIFITTHNGITPFNCKSARETASFINEIILRTPLIDLEFIYPTTFSKKKVDKINALSGNYEQESYFKLLFEYLLLLLPARRLPQKRP